MNWGIFFLRTQVIADIPFDKIVEYLSRKANRGDRYELKSVDKTNARMYYAYRQGLYERLGYEGGPTNEIIITYNLADKTKVVIDFRTPYSIIIAYGIIAIFILAIGPFLAPGLGLQGFVIILLALYFGTVIRMVSQFYFFKSDLQQLVENFRRGIK